MAKGARKKTTIQTIDLPNNNEEVEPLSNFQDTEKTGRLDVRDNEVPTITINGDASDAIEAFEEASTRPKRKTIDIRSAELVDQMFCNFKYKHIVGPNTVNTVSTKSEVPVHQDLVIAFRRLDAHLALKCEEVELELIGNIEDIDHEPTAEKISKFLVTDFTIGGKGDAMSVILKGTKELSTGETLKLETPSIVIDDSYPFAMELADTIQECISEVEEYMKGKQAENPQQELPFQDPAEEPYAEEDL